MAERAMPTGARNADSDPMNQWLEKNRRERQQEVEQLAQQAAKEIGEHRAAIASFMSAPEAHANGASTSLGEQQQQQPTNEAQAIVVEITGLFNARPVTSLLRSNRFRRQLEQVVRASLPAISDHSSQRSRSPAPSLTSAASATPSTESGHSSASSRVTTQRNVGPFVPPSAQPIRAPVVVSAPPPQQLVAPAYSDGVRPPIPPTFERLVDDDRDNLMMRVNQEDLIQDISELVHRGLVSNVLESNFRDILENSMQQHLTFTHNNGQQSLETLRTLRPANRIRNDFRDLGIALPQEQDDDDNISILSATAHAVPMSQTPAASAREIRSLRQEMHEMKATIRQLMDAQLETQRCIRQELSSALHGASGQTTAPAQPHPTAPANGGNCLICLTRPSDTMLYRCGHLCMCNGCSIELRHHQTTPTCPVCRAPVVDTVRVYAIGAPTPDR